MHPLYWIAFTPARKPDRIRLIHTKRTAIIGAISVTITEVKPAAHITKVESHILDRWYPYYTGYGFSCRRECYPGISVNL